MRIDRSGFLLAAGALLACHAEHKRRDEPGPIVAAAPEPEPSAVVEPDAGEPVADASATVAVDAGAADAAPDATEPPPPPVPPPTVAELAKRCRAFPPETECGGYARRAMCQTVIAEFDRATAARTVDCFEASGGCDACDIRTCISTSVAGSPRKSVRECESVRKAADASSPGYGEVMFELCEQYASGMTARGRARFTRCLTKNMGVGVRFCLWDPSTTPCTERGEERYPTLVPQP
jgi:hypothetical protein